MKKKNPFCKISASIYGPVRGIQKITFCHEDCVVFCFVLLKLKFTKYLIPELYAAVVFSIFDKRKKILYVPLFLCVSGIFPK